MKKRLLLALGLAAVLCVALAACGAAQTDQELPAEESGEAGTDGAADDAGEAADAGMEPVALKSDRQFVVVEGFDWGPGVTKTVLSFDTEIDAGSVTPESFSVVETKAAFDYAALSDESGTASPYTTTASPRVVTAAYVCNEDLQPDGQAASGTRVALELACDPNSGNPYCFDLLSWHNTICDPYELAVTLTETSTLKTAEGAPVSGMEVDPSIDLHIRYGGTEEDQAANLSAQFTIPQLADVDVFGVFTGTDGRTLRYASYEPEEDGASHPMVIWLHGAGEGGEDPTIPLLGNKVSPLFGDEFQSVFGGAYVLCPQAPDFWMVYNENGDWQDNPGAPSVYTAVMKELIDSYIADHPNVDTNRIVIGGCSNGGYMTMNMIFAYPDFFAAAYPVCEAYKDSGITEDQLAAIQNLPVWFIYAENDDTVIPDQFEVPTIARLRAMGANVHASIFPNVVDTSGLYQDSEGNPYEYAGHWSWLYFFNNECEEDGINLWQWLAAQDKGSLENQAG